MTSCKEPKRCYFNGFYGATGTPSFRFFNLIQAEAITLSGQFTVMTAERTLNDLMNALLKTRGVEYVVYADTDSCFLSVETLVERVCPGWENGDVVDFLDTFAREKIQPTLEAAFEKMRADMNAYDQRISMKREKIIDKAIFTAKKRYILSVLDEEGIRFSEPEIKVTGLESVRSTTPEVCRDYLKRSFKEILTGDVDRARSFIDAVRAEWADIPVEDIALTTSVDGLDVYFDGQTLYRDRTPMHVRAAILYNHKIAEDGLQNKYEVIKNSDKIKYTYLTMPNPTGENVMAFVGILPPEFGLHDYVDRNKMFERSFLSPLDKIFESIGWSIEERSALEFS